MLKFRSLCNGAAFVICSINDSTVYAKGDNNTATPIGTLKGRNKRIAPLSGDKDAIKVGASATVQKACLITRRLVR